MIIVFTAEHDQNHEIENINQLFEEGLEALHFRKPHFNFEKCVDFLEKIDASYHSKIMTHQFHGLTEMFDLNGVHFKETFRKSISTNIEDFVLMLQTSGFEISTGFHNVDELIDNEYLYDYTFLSPVFDSISKLNYQKKVFDFEKLKQCNNRVIALGGIHKENISQVFEKGFDGVAVLGSIWQANDPIKAYKELKKAGSNLCSLSNIAI